jgi:hypothetical protein
MLIDPIEKVDGQRNRQRMGVDVHDSSPSEALQSSTLNHLHDHLLLPLTVAHHLLYFYRLSMLSNSGSGPAILSKTYIHSLDTSVSVVQPLSFSYSQGASCINFNVRNGPVEFSISEADLPNCRTGS